MEQQKLMDELNYHRAQKLTDALYHSGLISFEEYDKLTLKNRHSFSPIYVDLLPKKYSLHSAGQSHSGASAFSHGLKRRRRRSQQ